MKQSDFPIWAQKIKEQSGGTTLRQIGNAIYLYQGTSRRVSGKKYPVLEETYFGIVTEEGLIKAESFSFYPLQTEVRSIDAQFKIKYDSVEDQTVMKQLSVVRKKGKWMLPRMTDEQKSVVEKYFVIVDGGIVQI